MIPECDARVAVAVSDQIRAVAKERLQSRLGFVSNGNGGAGAASGRSCNSGSAVQVRFPATRPKKLRELAKSVNSQTRELSKLCCLVADLSFIVAHIQCDND